MQKPQPFDFGFTKECLRKAEETHSKIEMRIMFCSGLALFLSLGFYFFKDFGWIGFIFALPGSFLLGYMLGLGIYNLLLITCFRNYYKFRRAKKKYDKWLSLQKKFNG